MKYFRLNLLIFLALALGACAQKTASLRVATFNVSVEASNYLSRAEIAQDPTKASIVSDLLKGGNHPQLQNIAEIIQRTRPDILLLNEFDYIENPAHGIQLFLNNYLAVSQNDQRSINYPYFYIAPVNTGVATAYDLDNDGRSTGNAGDAYGFGYYPGQYGMAIVSRFPIQEQQVRSLQTFLWKDMPAALQPLNSDGTSWYGEDEWSALRLSSKSLWDIPITTDKGVLHIIAAHPTPPTFDGDEDRNGKRNHDEIRLITDYLHNQDYLYDDNSKAGGLANDSRFVVLGDLNSSAHEGDSLKQGIESLLGSHLLNSSCVPVSEGGQEARSDKPYAAQHTASWGLRVDYALPSQHGVDLLGCGMFWPTKQQPEYALIANRQASSDHRLVWVDIRLK